MIGGMNNGRRDWLTAPEAAAIVGVTATSICRYIKAGQLRAVDKMPGASGAWILDPAEVLRFKRERQAKASGQVQLDLDDQAAAS